MMLMLAGGAVREAGSSWIGRFRWARHAGLGRGTPVRRVALRDEAGRRLGIIVAPQGAVRFGPNNATLYLRREYGT